MLYLFVGTEGYQCVVVGSSEPPRRFWMPLSERESEWPVRARCLSSCIDLLYLPLPKQSFLLKSMGTTVKVLGATTAFAGGGRRAMEPIMTPSAPSVCLTLNVLLTRCERLAPELV